MHTLIIGLPVEPVTTATEFDFVVAEDGDIMETGRARAAALPQLNTPGCELVALAPLRALSWHPVELPEGVTPGSARLREVLDGLLEDQLLDEPSRLHFALPPQAHAGAPQWVAACERRWLAMAVQALEAERHPVTRVVPEWGPPGSATRVHLGGTLSAPELVVWGPDSVQAYPLERFSRKSQGADTDGAADLERGPFIPPEALDPTIPLTAEPDLAALAEYLLQRQPQPLARADHWIAASLAPWDLAKRLQMRKRAKRSKLEWLRAPRWRAARWAGAALVGVNLLGLNALAWQHTKALQTRQLQSRTLLLQTFPDVKIVRDAPLQMTREVRRLEQATAAPAHHDLDVMLGAVIATLPQAPPLQALDYANGQLRLRGLDLPAPQQALTIDMLRARGYKATVEADTLVVQALAPSRSGS